MGGVDNGDWLSVRVVDANKPVFVAAPPGTGNKTRPINEDGVDVEPVNSYPEEFVSGGVAGCFAGHVVSVDNDAVVRDYKHQIAS
jgi:hypothetical protein